MYTAHRRHGTIYAWDLRTHLDAPLATYVVSHDTDRTNQKIKFDIDPAGRWLASGDHRGSISIFDLHDPDASASPETVTTTTKHTRPVLEFPAHDDAVGSVAFHPLRPSLLSVSGSRHFLAPDSDSDSDSDANTETRVVQRVRPTVMDQSIKTCETFEAASDAIQEIMTKSALSDGSGSRTLTEPLLIWIDWQGSKIVQATVQSGDVDDISHSLCKLIVALGDHSTSYISANLASPITVVPAPSPPGTPIIPTKTRGELCQSFLRLVLSYTGLRGYYGVDEEESEMTLAFWYLFQEALWSNDYYVEEDVEGSGSTTLDAGAEVQVLAKAAYSELVQVLRRKVAFPGKGAGWSKGVFLPTTIHAQADTPVTIDQVEKFQV
ncbi:hypothetical protein C0992_003156 [Termitomyces sp. T32_za158]|nr:hypothetical protein C0992_003156 [Termitomyces sp. T32_za158]